ncbi:MAG: MmgE/PrpD family protein [Chloroflexota bacterium]|nr:MmgE/PrpD family protein [Chloroflexota bacterium]MDE2884569.1 MmgE/PrpD family protein [Chloroflexota bacterium]
MTDPVVERLTSYAAGLEYRDLPSEVVHQVKRLVIDSLGCGLAAAGAAPVRAARGLALEVRASSPATLLGTTDATTPDMAAFVNGTMVRYLDFNDSYNGKDIAHPSDNIPAVLAAAEAQGASGRELIAAVALAYEVQAAWADSFQLASGGAWDQAAYAAISAPLGAGKAMGLSAEQLGEALRISVVSSMTLGEARRGTISHWKAAAVPNAGRNGVFAAMLARRGMTGPPEVFSGSHGFFAGVAGGPVDLAPLAGEGGTDHAFRLMESRFKRFPAGFVSQTAIEGAIEARDVLGITDTDDIRHVHIRTFESGKRIMAGDPTRWRPETRETADHSIPFVVACALRFGTLEPAHFEDDILRDPALLDLMQRIEVVQDPECDAAWPEAILNILTVRVSDGRQHTASVPYYTGHYKKPMSDADVEDKFRRLTSGLLDEVRQQTALDRLWRLDEETDLGRVMASVAIA